jgi:hypothetical protein
MHAKRCYLRKILSHHPENGELLQGVHSRVCQKDKNIEADELAKAAARKTALPPDVFFQTIEDSSIKIIKSEPRMVNIIQGED